MGPKTHHVTNGLLLRSDIHTLFDLGLIGIDPRSLKVVLASELKKTRYKELDGKKVKIPGKRAMRLSTRALQKKWEEFNGKD